MWPMDLTSMAGKLSYEPQTEEKQEILFSIYFYYFVCQSSRQNP